MNSGQGPDGGSEEGRIRSQLEKLVSSPGLASSPRRQQLLRFLIEQALGGRGEHLNEYGIAVDVFGRPASFDPRLDSIVRTETSRLRQKLSEYYSAEGSSDPVLIEIPRRNYAPSITFRETSVKPDELGAWATNSPRRSRWIAISAAMGLLAVLGAAGVWGLRSAGGTNPPPGSLAVLPFQNLSPNPDAAYLADGVTEELTNELAQWTDLRVVARTSASQFKGKGLDIREIGKKLNVGEVLEGSVEREGDSIRVTAQLNRTSDGYHLWSHRYETSNGGLLKVQAEIANTVEAAIHPYPAGTSRAISTKAPRIATSNPEAHDLYLRGYYQYSLRSPASQKAGLQLFLQAATADPSYVAAYIGIARSEIALIHLTAEAPMAGLEPIRQALTKALEIDPKSAEARGLLGYIYYNYDWNWNRAEREYQLALEEGGSEAGTRSSYAWGLATRGRFREANEQFQIAQDLDPLAEGPRINQFFAYYLEHKYEDAKAILGKLLEMNPDLLDAHLLLGLTAAIGHDCDKALSEFEWSARKYDMPVTKFGLAAGAACRGEKAEARSLLSAMSASKGPAFASPYQLALGYAFLHDRENAMSELERSAELREGQILYLKYEPVFDEIRTDPRYVALERRIGLE